MKIDYFGEFSEQTERIELMLSADDVTRGELKEKGDKWRLLMADKLDSDLLPPLDRRDLMSIIQNLCYILYEVWRLPGMKFFHSAEGLLMKIELEQSLQMLKEEIKGLKSKTASVKRLRGGAYRLLSVWHSSFVAGCDRVLCDGYEAAGDAILRLADALETAMAVN